MRAKKEQKTTWMECGHDDLRRLDAIHKLPEAELMETFDDINLVITVLEQKLGFNDLSTSEVVVETPLGMVRIDRDKLEHIVEKRKDARERYVEHALATMRDPLEIWVVEYGDDDGNQEFRDCYIGVFEGKHQMLVVCAEINGKILWNYMQCDAKSLNKHRHGECIYRRPTEK